MQKISLLVLLLLARHMLPAQVSGNQVFSTYNDGSSGGYGRQESHKAMLQTVALGDSAFVVQAKVLKNVQADYYIAVFGVSQEARTVTDANNTINTRIRSFIDNVKKLGIRESDIYTDIIAQYRVYDLRQVTDSYVEEYLKGFETGKNVIIRYDRAAQIEQLLTLASQDSIYDLVKVDYVVNDVARVYEDLFDVATDVIKKKKELYLELISLPVRPLARIQAESFSSYYPSEMYKGYKAASTNFYESYFRSYDQKKAMRKFTTFYYDKLDESGFDKIINPAVLEPVVQFVFTLQVRYDFKK
jgi:uncharacterized protein YggE